MKTLRGNSLQGFRKNTKDENEHRHTKETNHKIQTKQSNTIFFSSFKNFLQQHVFVPHCSPAAFTGRKRFSLRITHVTSHAHSTSTMIKHSLPQRPRHTAHRAATASMAHGGRARPEQLPVNGSGIPAHLDGLTNTQ